MTEEYKRTCRDEIDWTEIDQLHAATIQLSGSCYEYKKTFVAVLGVAITALIAITKGNIDNKYFIIPIIISLGFWLSDANSYFYQRKLRNNISRKMEEIAKRNNIQCYSASVIETSGIHALINTSMILYYIFIGFSVIAWYFYTFNQTR